ncbi:hypothetical protein JCM19294_2695 [Nonlabens tegetincola]|uniref:Uncharacterized protein n=1 Tax=Nonlabens tegetincola TaxID=323273 RepID=A0A090Q2H3_9FLAO|nr:hypothetical protein JCM19294_2695 [Nonlabens tegetincola]
MLVNLPKRSITAAVCCLTVKKALNKKIRAITPITIGTMGINGSVIILYKVNGYVKVSAYLENFKGQLPYKNYSNSNISIL